jgi:hypothetical protein
MGAHRRAHDSHAHGTRGVQDAHAACTEASSAPHTHTGSGQRAGAEQCCTARSVGAHTHTSALGGVAKTFSSTSADLNVHSFNTPSTEAESRASMPADGANTCRPWTRRLTR